jgi:hypothetical protein
MAGAGKRRFNRTEKLAALQTPCKGNCAIKNDIDRDLPDRRKLSQGQGRWAKLSFRRVPRYLPKASCITIDGCRQSRPKPFGNSTA